MSFLEPLWEFLNSKFGLLVSGFFLTTLAGTFLTYWFTRESKKHEVRFVKLHEERAKAIKTFHDKTVKMTEVFEDLDNYLSEYGEPEKAARETGVLGPKEIKQNLEEFHALSEEYKIYFSDELSDLIDQICDLFNLYFDKYYNITDFSLEVFLPIKEKRTHSTNRLIESLRQEFRILLGVK